MRDFDQQLLRMKAVLGMTSDQAVAAALGMTKAAFSDRKRRGAFPEDKLRGLAQQRPELLLDVDYVLTGRRLYEEAAVRHATMMEAARRQLGLSGQSPNVASTQHLPVSDSNAATSHHLTADELELLELFRAATLSQKMEAVAVLTGGTKKKASRPKPAESAGVNVRGSRNRAAGRDYHEKE